MMFIGIFIIFLILAGLAIAFGVREDKNKK